MKSYLYFYLQYTLEYNIIEKYKTLVDAFFIAPTRKLISDIKKGRHEDDKLECIVLYGSIFL